GLKDVNAISAFSLDTGSDGVALTFDDLVANRDAASNPEYQYEITNGDRRSEKTNTSTPRIVLGQAVTGETKVKIWTTRGGTSFSPVSVYLGNKPGGTYGIFRIERSL